MSGNKRCQARAGERKIFGQQLSLPLEPAPVRREGGRRISFRQKRAGEVVAAEPAFDDDMP